MACLSSRSFPEDVDRQRGAHPTTTITQRSSALPPAPTPDELLAILRDAARLLSSSDTADATNPPAEAAPHAAGYGAYIKRQCPTERRVHSSFAAAGAHSTLGEMLQFFAHSITRLFTEGVESPSVVAFPSTWEQRLNAPDAAVLRDKYLYELQGFSALFTFVWANVAALGASPASLPGGMPRRHGERGEGEGYENVDAEDYAKEGRSTRVSTAAPAAAGLPIATSPLRSVGERRILKVRRTTPVANTGAAGSAAAPLLPQLGQNMSSYATGDVSARTALPAVSNAFGSGHGVTSPSKSTTTNTPFARSINNYPSRQSTVSAFGGSSRRHQSLPLSSSDTASSEAAGNYAKSHRHFLPSLPLEGLVPSGHPSETERHLDDSARRGRKASPQRNGETASPPALRLSPSARQQAIQQAMEQDRARELRRTLGVRTVRNFAKEGDMQEYLHAFQENMHSVLDGDVDDGRHRDGDGGKANDFYS